MPPNPPNSNPPNTPPNNPTGPDPLIRPLTAAEVELARQYRDVLTGIDLTTERGRKRFREMVNASADLRRALAGIDLDLENLADRFGQIKGAFRDITAEIKTAIDAQRNSILLTRGTGTEFNQLLKNASAVNGVIRSINTSLNKATSLTDDYNENILKTSDVTKEIRRVNSLMLDIEQLKANGTARSLGLSDAMLNKLKAQLDEELKSLEILKGQNKEIDKAVGIVGKVADGIKKIPIIGDVLNLEGFQEAMRSAAKQGQSVFGAAFKNIKAGFADAFEDPLIRFTVGLTILTKLFKTVFNAAYDVNVQSAGIAKNLGLSVSAGRDVNAAIRQAVRESDSLLVNSKELVELQNTLNESLGLAVTLDQTRLRETSEIAKALGLNADQANTLYLLDKKTTANIYEQVNQFNKSNKTRLSAKALASDILKSEGLLKLQLTANTQAFIAQSVAAAKVGTNIKEARDAAKGFLDFESSITSQMEAEVLLGKSIELNQARALALQGRFGEAAEAALKNVGGIQQFSKMNVLQQEALAQSLNMSVDQLSDVIFKREKINTLAQSEIDKLRASTDLQDRKKADLLEQNLLQGQSLDDAKAAAEEENKRALIADRFKEALGGIVAPVQAAVAGIYDKFFKPIANFVNQYPLIGQILGGIAAVTGLMLIVSSIKGVFGLMTGRGINTYVTNLGAIRGGGPGGGPIPPVAPGGGPLRTAGRMTTSGGLSVIRAGAPTPPIVSPGARMMGGLSRVGGVAMKGAIPGAIAGIGLSYGADAAAKAGKQGLATTLGTAGGVLTGASTGAMLGGVLGSVIPGIGNAVGAGVGAIAGGLIGGISSLISRMKDAEEQKQAAAQTMQNSGVQVNTTNEEVPGLATGGTIRQEGIAKVHKGELISNTGTVAAMTKATNEQNGLLKEQNALLLAISKKQNIAVIDSDSMARGTATATAMGYGILLNPTSRLS